MKPMPLFIDQSISRIIFLILFTTRAFYVRHDRNCQI